MFAIVGLTCGMTFSGAGIGQDAPALPGWDDAFHAAPRRYAVLLEGGLSVTASDSETVMMKAGDMILLNDAGSKGHLSKVQGDQPARFLMIGCPAQS